MIAMIAATAATSVVVLLGLLAPPEQPAESSPTITEPAVEQADSTVESPPIPIRPPEQVQAEAKLGNPPAPGQPTPPNPQARPSEGVYAVGSSGVAPLPPPPPPVPIDTIAQGRWSGVGWLSVRLIGVGPIAGEAPARPSVISLGGGLEGGWRIRQWIGLGAAFSRQAHEVYRQVIPGNPNVVWDSRGYMTAWDLGFVRLFAPVRGRFDPFIDVGGGLAQYDPARDRRSSLGATVRASVGFDVWVGRNLTLGLAGLYRANFLDAAIGHSWQAAFDFGIHW